ncbi:Polyribonucleotide nucleotidyltransferase [Parasponia andersonii]|uniref:Polyribonucleotide nucleotidyltransferase n=1 Tax=Parasponia andersonii TaxID=3476 RepID=A0A2P5BGD7_PARAD|nr:Polyribonucleotide nucleotidyltransferase [Parasponia andersonii]
MEEKAPEKEILSVFKVQPGKMGRIIGKNGVSILTIKKSCNAEILIRGENGPHDKVLIIGPVKQVRKAAGLLRGRL